MLFLCHCLPVATLLLNVIKIGLPPSAQTGFLCKSILCWITLHTILLIYDGHCTDYNSLRHRWRQRWLNYVIDLFCGHVLTRIYFPIFWFLLNNLLCCCGLLISWRSVAFGRSSAARSWTDGTRNCRRPLGRTASMQKPISR